MACSLCRLPFAPKNTTPWLPPGMLSDDQVRYMKRVVAIGPYVPGIVADMVLHQSSMFMGPNPYVVSDLMAAYNERMLIPMHAYCATLFRHHAGLLDNDFETFVELSLLDNFVGLPESEEHVGLLPHMDYEVNLGDDGLRVDINVLWSAGPQESPHNFNWHEWKRLGLQWTAAPPTLFPRFEPSLTPDRQESARRPVAETSDILTTLPLDIMRLILEHPALSDESFVRVLATCRTFRTHALTTFQPIARTRVIALGWALPIPLEYSSFVQRVVNKSPIPDGTLCCIRVAQLPLPHAEYSPLYGDWLQYLAQVLCMPNMRARRWLWTLATRLAAVRAERRAASEYAEVEGEGGVPMRSKAWMARAREMR